MLEADTSCARGCHPVCSRLPFRVLKAATPTHQVLPFVLLGRVEQSGAAPAGASCLQPAAVACAAPRANGTDGTDGGTYGGTGAGTVGKVARSNGSSSQHARTEPGEGE